MENSGGKGLFLLVGREKDTWPGKKWELWRLGDQSPGSGRAASLLWCLSPGEDVSFCHNKEAFPLTQVIGCSL